VRITAQLIRVSDGFHVWSESYDREIDSVFALQDEIAQRLAEQLKSTLGGDSPLQARASVDPQAYDDFLKARVLYRDRRNTLKALQLFRSAVERDPGFAVAWANLALACEVAAYHSTATQQQLAGDRIACMQEAVGRAAALAPGAAITLHAQANLARAEGRFLDAERLYLESIASDGTYPDVREDYAELLSSVGRLADSAEAVRALVRLEPTSTLFWHRLAVVALLTDDAELIDAVVAKVATIDPTYLYSLTSPFRHALCHGRMDAARAALDRAFAATPDAVATMLFLFRWSQGDPGMDDQLARELLRTTFYIDGPAMVAAKGDADLYFQVIGNPRDRDKRFDTFRQLACPSASAMLTDARAHAFLREAGFEAYWREKGWPPQCRPLGDSDFECRPASYDPLPAAARWMLESAEGKGP
jgi:adenylate cyclase